ncbi:DUF4330 family protein [Haloglomus halophilum]|uniref:DUF4330 family protein n=1 Tax=Haloglomus halophilum TaxID=2962672 RepID=UPI0020C9DD3C|nr:DUF4330 family protein [Haloglomus halophilum]
MGIVDEEGRLFGVVNVIDLVVAAVVLAALASGAVFVLTDDSEPTEQRYLTVVLDERPGGSVPTLDSDSVAMPDGPVQIGGTDGRITDTYIAPTGDSGFVTVARIRVDVSVSVADRTTDRRLVAGGETYLVGQEVDLNARETHYTGYIHSVGRSGNGLSVRTVNATVVARLPPSVAERIQAGDIQRVAGREIAQVTAVDRQPTADERTRVEATVSLRVLVTDDEPLYGTQQVRPGAEVWVAPNDYEFTGTVTEAA